MAYRRTSYNGPFFKDIRISVPWRIKSGEESDSDPVIIYCTELSLKSDKILYARINYNWFYVALSSLRVRSPKHVWPSLWLLFLFSWPDKGLDSIIFSPNIHLLKNFNYFSPLRAKSWNDSATVVDEPCLESTSDYHCRFSLIPRDS